MANPNETPLFDGVFRYLLVRNWAFEKMKTCPRGSPLLDIQICHYLFFSNALAAVDLVGENFYGDDFRKPAYKTPYEQSLIASFDLALTGTRSTGSNGRETYAYVRELRNSMMHRGLDPAVAGHANDEFVFALCPATVRNSTGNQSHGRPCTYMVELGRL
jgi:hypothetical protein